MSPGKQLALFLGAGLVLLGCNRSRATPAQCRAIFDRIVEIELAEMGFSDAVLAARKQQELSARYQSEIQSCVGRPLPERALECVARARSTEELSHDCLR